MIIVGEYCSEDAPTGTTSKAKIKISNPDKRTPPEIRTLTPRYLGRAQDDTPSSRHATVYSTYSQKENTLWFNARTGQDM